MNGIVEVYVNLQVSTNKKWSGRNSTKEATTLRELRHNWSQDSPSPISGSSQKPKSSCLRRTNAERSLQNKKRVIKMLFAVVLEFFICWTPLYIINTIVLFEQSFIYNSLGYTAISFFQLLAYTSSCCNPITYCFMNYGFRKSFLNLFRCLKRFKSGRRFPTLNESEFNMETKWSNKCPEPPWLWLIAKTLSQDPFYFEMCVK